MRLVRFLLVLSLGLALVSAATEDNEISSQEDGDDDETVEIVTASAPVDDEESGGPFVPPNDEDMLKFEAKDAIIEPPPQDQPQTAEDGDKSFKIAADLYESAMALLNSGAGTNPASRHQAWRFIDEAAELGNVDAKVKIGLSKLLGTHYQQDVAKAKEIFEKAAGEEGHPDAQFFLGFLHATGTLVPSSQSKALLYYSFAAFGGSSYAQMALGYRNWAGMGVATSCEKALDYYRRVASSVADKVSFGGGPALQRTRLQDEYENGGHSNAVLDNDLIEYYQLLADKGDVDAQVGLGQVHYQGGRGIEVNHRLALHFFTQAAEMNNPVALAMLGKLHLMGSGDFLKANNETAYMYFKKAADMGNAIGQSGMGLMYLEGRGVTVDFKKAMDYFRKTADQQWVDGQLQLGNMYYHGTGVKPDYKMAVKYFNLASQSGHVLAFFNLAEMHAMGTGMLRSCPTAVELYKNVAERGKWGELMMEAHSDYRRGNLEEAIVKYLLLAELGYEHAQSNVAFMYDRKEIGSQLYKEDENWLRALVYWTRAASQGYSAARVRLGDYYYYGLGTDIDFEAAAFHYRIASEQQNNAQAMFNLGYMHELGHGMPQDIHLAKRFYDMAADTSTDAKVPVALALTKLAFTFFVNNWQNYKVHWALSPETWAKLELYWDLYLLSILIGILGVVVFIRRTGQQAAQPAQHGQQQAAQPPNRARPHQPVQPRQPPPAANPQSANPQAAQAAEAGPATAATAARQQSDIVGGPEKQATSADTQKAQPPTAAAAADANAGPSEEPTASTSGSSQDQSQPRQN